MLASLPRAAWWSIVIVALFAWFAMLDVRILLHPDEGRYAEIAREMAVTGDFVTPRLNGLKYFEKPPLQYWMTAIAFKAFAVDEWTARLAPALGGLIAILAVGFTLARLEDTEAGVFGALALSGMVWHLGMSHLLTLDALLTGWLTLALCGFLLAQRDGLGRGVERRWMLLVYGALAAATLTKGPVALIIAAGSLVTYSLVTRDVGPWLRLHLAPGLAVFLALTAPWFVMVSNANPEFARFFFVHEHLARFFTTEHRRGGTWYYFIPVFVLGAMPWLLAWAWTLPRSWRTARVNRNGFAWPRFCLAWAAFIFLFFSLSSSKLPSYILPLFPALALILGWQFERLPARTLLWQTIPTVLLVLIVTAAMWMRYDAIVAGYAALELPPALFRTFATWLLLAAGILAAGGLVAALCFHRGTPRAKTLGIAVAAISTLVGFQAAFMGHNAFQAPRSAHSLLTRAASATGGLDPQAPFFQVQMYDQTLPYYLGRTTTVVSYRDELALGLDAEPDKGIRWDIEWVERWKALPQGYALMKPSSFDEYNRAGVPLRVLARNAGLVLVARR